MKGKWKNKGREEGEGGEGRKIVEEITREGMKK